MHIGDKFAVRPLIKAYNRTHEYLVMLLSQSGVGLYEAINDIIKTFKQSGYKLNYLAHTAKPLYTSRKVRKTANYMTNNNMIASAQSKSVPALPKTPRHFHTLAFFADVVDEKYPSHHFLSEKLIKLNTINIKFTYWY